MFAFASLLAHGWVRLYVFVPVRATVLASCSRVMCVIAPVCTPEFGSCSRKWFAFVLALHFALVLELFLGLHFASIVHTRFCVCACVSIRCCAQFASACSVFALRALYCCSLFRVVSFCLYRCARLRARSSSVLRAFVHVPKSIFLQLSVRCVAHLRL